MENLRLDDFTKYKFLSGLKISPAGQYIGFVLHQMDVEENKYLSNIYIYDLQDKAAIKITSLDEERSFLWKNESTLSSNGISCLYEDSTGLLWIGTRESLNSYNTIEIGIKGSFPTLSTD